VGDGEGKGSVSADEVFDGSSENYNGGALYSRPNGVGLSSGGYAIATHSRIVLS
jgi:hypothetical protein